MPKQKRARGGPKKNWMEGIRKAMNGRNLSEDQWEDRKQWSLCVAQRRTTFWNRYIHTYRNYHYSLRNDPEKRSPYVCICWCYYNIYIYISIQINLSPYCSFCVVGLDRLALLSMLHSRLMSFLSKRIAIEGSGDWENALCYVINKWIFRGSFFRLLLNIKFSWEGQCLYGRCGISGMKSVYRVFVFADEVLWLHVTWRRSQLAL